MALSEQCLQQLGLHTAPFEDIPDEGFVYSDPLLDGLLESARQALDAPGAIVMLTGENGSGRSLQLMRLLGMLPESFELIAFKARINTQFEAVDVTIRNYLRSQNADDPDRSLTELLAARIAEGVTPVVAMDDAHLVGTDIVNNLMRMRSEILESHGRAPRIVLVGSPGLLRRRLYLPDPGDEDQITRVSLRAFNLEQTAAYLRHRLQAAGMDDPGHLLDQDTINQLQTASQGLPANLNREANRLLEQQCRHKRPDAAPGTTAPLPGLAPETGEPAEDREEPPTTEATQNEPATFEGESPAPESAGSGLRANREEEAEFTPAVTALAGQQADVEPTSAASGTPEPEATPTVQPDHPATPPTASPFWNQRWFVPAVAATVALGIAAPVAWQLLDSEPVPPDSEVIELPLPEQRVAEAPQDDDEEVAVSDPFATAPAPLAEPEAAEPEPSRPDESDSDPAPDTPPESVPPTEPNAAPEPEPDPAPEPEPAPAPPSAPESEPAPEPAPEPTPDPGQERLNADRAWLAERDPAATTIQLMAAPDLPTARAFADRHNLGAIRYVPTRVGDRDFVVILAGVFPDRAAAERAVADLPDAVRRTEPWIRSIGSVQSAVRE